MENLNKVMLMGHPTRAPKMKALQSGPSANLDWRRTDTTEPKPAKAGGVCFVEITVMGNQLISAIEPDQGKPGLHRRKTQAGQVGGQDNRQERKQAEGHRQRSPLPGTSRRTASSLKRSAGLPAIPTTTTIPTTSPAIR